MSCAQCEGIEHQFDRGEARKKLRHFRRRGPDKTTRLLIEGLRAALSTSNTHDATLLDIGAGVGAIHHELLNDRVICCFDDMHALVQRSARKAGRFYGAVYPRQIGWMRVAIAAINLLQQLKRSTFRVFLHDPAAIDAELRAAGLERTSRRQTLGWEVVVYARAS